MFNPNNQLDLFRAFFQVPLQPQEKLAEIWNAIDKTFNAALFENAKARGLLNRKFRTEGSLNTGETSELVRLEEEKQHIQQWQQALQLLKSSLTSQYLGAFSQTIEGLETIGSLASNISISIMRDAYEMILDRIACRPPATTL